MRPIYILTANQISLQQPLSEQWITAPEVHQEPYMRSVDPDFKPFVSPGEARRLGKVLKRALAVSVKSLREAGIEHPDAIIMGTGLGSVESTEAFLIDVCNNGEQLLSPTHFMQSTHNTISSLVAISTKSHGYNATYSHKGISFESALYDAWLQLSSGDIETALVGGHDGVTAAYFHLLELVDYVGNGMKGTCGEVAMSALLSGKDSEDSALCRLGGIKLLYKPSAEILSAAIRKMLADKGLTLAEIYVMTGHNGKSSNDEQYDRVLGELLPEVPQLHYKRLFGECFTAGALGFYAAAQMLHEGQICPSMLVGEERSLRAILQLHIDTDGDCALTLLVKK